MTPETEPRPAQDFAQECAEALQAASFIPMGETYANRAIKIIRDLDAKRQPPAKGLEEIALRESKQLWADGFLIDPDGDQDGCLDITGLQNAVSTYILRACQDARAAKEREMIQWRSLAQEMTPGGSEFMEVESVRAYYRKFKDDAHKAKLDRAKLQRQLAASATPSGSCVICGEPITPYDSYGVGKVPSARYHWHCIRAEAETVSPPSGWIALSERKPTAEDADESGAVLFRWYDGLMRVNIDRVVYHADAALKSSLPTHWLPLPKFAQPDTDAAFEKWLKESGAEQKADRTCWEDCWHAALAYRDGKQG